MRAALFALLVLGAAACGSSAAPRVAVAQHARPRAVLPPPPMLPPPRPVPPPPAPDALAGVAAPLPEALVRPRLVGLARRGGAWAVALEDSPASGERVVWRAPDDLARDVAPPVPVAPPLGWAVAVVDDALVLTADADGRLFSLGPEDAAPELVTRLSDAPLRAASSRIALVRRASGLGGVVVARVADEEVHPFAHPHTVEHEHVVAQLVGSPARRPLALEETPPLVTAWLAAAASDAESAVVRVEAPRAAGDSLDGSPRAVVHVVRIAGAGTRTASAPAPGVTLDAVAAYAPDGTLGVAFLDAHEGAHALVLLAFPAARGRARTVTLDAPGPLADGDAALASCGGALWAVTATDTDLGVQRALPEPGERAVLWRGDASHEGHVLATACDAGALVVALQRAPALAHGTLVTARVDLRPLISREPQASPRAPKPNW